MLAGAGASLPLAPGDHQWHEYGLLQDEQHQEQESWQYGTREQERHAGGDEERPEPEVEAEPKG
jgi:hypothetical protein